MATQYQRDESVILIVVTPIELEPGLVLPSGSYRGTSKQLGFPRTDCIGWTRPEIFIRLTGDRLIGMGMKYVHHATLMEYELTRYVSLGAVTVERDPQAPTESEHVGADSA
jgi:hypothetical protein